MCGILFILGLKGDELAVRKQACALTRRQRHRGPDQSGIMMFQQQQDPEKSWVVFCQERLMINDLSDSGRQPKQVANDFIYMSNGEIYNDHQIRKDYGQNYKFEGTSDCEAYGALYAKFGYENVEQAFNEIEGQWAVASYDMRNEKFILAKDHIGICPLYFGYNKDGVLFASSELKVIHDVCDQSLEILLPGHYLTNGGVQKRWYQPKWQDLTYIPTIKYEFQEFRNQVIKAVKMQMQSDAPFGFLVSGGVDSSLIAAIGMKLIRDGEIDIKKCGMDRIHTFCIGLENSPDLLASRQVANFIGSTHHEFVYTVQEGLDVFPDVVYHTETYNATTIRASTPMYFLARKIKGFGIKMVLTGEGADELLGGYLYFHKAPNREEFHKELVRKVNDLYKYDLLRANKSCMAWGLEVRPPFLQKELIEYVMSIDPSDKMPHNNEMRIEKYILRAAFDCPEDPYLPKEVLWRQKEQFSDGVGYQWLDSIKALAEREINNELWGKRELIYPVNTPMSKEMFMHRNTFSQFFPSDKAALTVPCSKSIACSTEFALDWDESFKRNTDESGRAVMGVHVNETYIQDSQK